MVWKILVLCKWYFFHINFPLANLGSNVSSSSMGGAMGALLTPNRVEARLKLSTTIAKAVKKSTQQSATPSSAPADAGPAPKPTQKNKSPPLKLTSKQAEELARFQFNANTASLRKAQGFNYGPLDQRSYIGDRSNIPYKVELKSPHSAAKDWNCVGKYCLLPA